jgi:colicin import membrane protein
MTPENKYKIKGWLGTILFHLGVLLVLLFFAFTTQLPLPGEEGVEISLGYDNTGMGDIQPENIETQEQRAQPQPAPEITEEEIVTQDTEPAPFVVEKKEEKKVEKVTEEPVEEVVEEQPQVNPAALYPGKSKNQSPQQSEGIIEGTGDQGRPEGSVDSKEYLGKGGFGDGVSYSLEGRNPSNLPLPPKVFKENGTIVVQITVDRYGKVVRAVAIDKGSNTTSTALRRLAEEAAMKAIFNANMSAAEFQRGTITYHFVVKN